MPIDKRFDELEGWGPDSQDTEVPQAETTTDGPPPLTIAEQNALVRQEVKDGIDTRVGRVDRVGPIIMNEVFKPNGKYL